MNAFMRVIRADRHIGAMGKTRRGRLLGWQGKQVQNQAQCGRWEGPELLPGSWEQPPETYFAAQVGSFARGLHSVTQCISLPVLGPGDKSPSDSSSSYSETESVFWSETATKRADECCGCHMWVQREKG